MISSYQHSPLSPGQSNSCTSPLNLVVGDNQDGEEASRLPALFEPKSFSDLEAEESPPNVEIQPINDLSSQEPGPLFAGPSSSHIFGSYEPQSQITEQQDPEGEDSGSNDSPSPSSHEAPIPPSAYPQPYMFKPDQFPHAPGFPYPGAYQFAPPHGAPYFYGPHPGYFPFGSPQRSGVNPSYESSPHFYHMYASTPKTSSHPPQFYYPQYPQKFMPSPGAENYPRFPPWIMPATHTPGSFVPPPFPNYTPGGSQSEPVMSGELFDQVENAGIPLPDSQGRTSSKSQHICNYCGKLYSRRYGLKIHLRTHSGYKPLKCTYCPRTFSDPSNLNKHTKLHFAGETPKHGIRKVPRVTPPPSNDELDTDDPDSFPQSTSISSSSYLETEITPKDASFEERSSKRELENEHDHDHDEDDDEDTESDDPSYPTSTAPYFNFQEASSSSYEPKAKYRKVSTGDQPFIVEPPEQASFLLESSTSADSAFIPEPQTQTHTPIIAEPPIQASLVTESIEERSFINETHDTSGFHYLQDSGFQDTSALAYAPAYHDQSYVQMTSYMGTNPFIADPSEYPHNNNMYIINQSSLENYQSNSGDPAAGYMTGLQDDSGLSCPEESELIPVGLASNMIPEPTYAQTGEAIFLDDI